ncbi:hypothetical protein UNSWDHB_959 [Dehalobacter sp. UNSWDHB]|nr:hypothetical protein DHBDCA_p1594 [Dehalobacter sp. DCA]AFV05609.1 hypothetical protein DCF50_p1605 [Dehalobacter sp. CF]EQB21755.1 hypothetical protein UNSWDHB_959 [Dehalobacter sp. UNSWDHB]
MYGSTEPTTNKIQLTITRMKDFLPDLLLGKIVILMTFTPFYKENLAGAKSLAAA